MYTFLSGGTGTPKLLQGFRNLVDDSKLEVICNTGDDYYWNSLLVSPDLDTVLYLFADILDLEKFWGRKNESFKMLKELRTFEDPDYLDTWFQIGDKDLSLHIFRNHYMNRGDSLSDVTNLLMDHWGIKAKVHPMSNEKVTTTIHSEQGDKYHFQEYFVKYRTEVDVKSVSFEGAEEAHITPYTFKSISAAKQIIIGPSNPVTSIGPILAVEEIRNHLIEKKEKVTVISPIVGSKAFSGPTSTLMDAVGMSASIEGLARNYKDVCSRIVLDEQDRRFKKVLEDMGIDPIFTDISLNDQQQKDKLAKFLMEVL